MKIYAQTTNIANIKFNTMMVVKVTPLTTLTAIELSCGV